MRLKVLVSEKEMEEIAKSERKPLLIHQRIWHQTRETRERNQDFKKEIIESACATVWHVGAVFGPAAAACMRLDQGRIHLFANFILFYFNIFNTYILIILFHINILCDGNIEI